MTNDASAGGSYTEDPAATEAWRQVLFDGFGEFLGRPLDKFDSDAQYGVYFWAGNFLKEIDFADDARWVDPEVLAGRILFIEDGHVVLYDEGEPSLRFDAAGSIFVIEDESALPSEFVADLAAVSFPSTEAGERLVLGRDLGVLLTKHSVDLTDDGLAGAWYVLYPRIASDGTLVDALRVATGIGEEPDSVIEFDGEPAEEWEADVARVTHPGLRAHLGFVCQEPGYAALSYMGADRLSFWGMEGEGCTVIAAWDETQNQVEVGVFQLAGALAPKDR